MIDKLILITSHCDTIKKLDVLRENIKKLNQYADVALFSKIPIDKDIQDSVKFFILDQKDTLLYWPDRGMKVWGNFENPNGGKDLYMEHITPDFGWSVFSQIKALGEYGLKHQYDYYYIYDYDVDFTDVIIDNLENPSEFKTFYHKHDKEITFIPGLVFSCFDRFNLKKLVENINLTDYRKEEIPEEYFKVITKKLFNIEASPEIVTDQCRKDGDDIFNINTEDLCKVFIQNKDKVIIYVHGMKKSVKFYVNNTPFIPPKDIGDCWLIETDIPAEKVFKIGYYDPPRWNGLLYEFHENTKTIIIP